MYFLRPLLKRSLITFLSKDLRNFHTLEKVHPKHITEIKRKNKIDNATIDLLEKLSLVDCVNEQDIKTLEAAVDFADQIFEVDTTGVTPLITVLEDYPLRVREDQVTEGNCKEDILKNASVSEDDYFVAPPGNIPLEGKSTSTDEN